MPYPSKNSSTPTFSSKNSASFSMAQQNIETWEVNINTWQAELRTWAELAGNTWSYQAKS